MKWTPSSRSIAWSCACALASCSRVTPLNPPCTSMNRLIGSLLPQGTHAPLPWRVRSGSDDLLDPRGERLDELAEVLARAFVHQIAVRVEEARDPPDVRLRLLHRRHVQEDEGLAQVVVRAEPREHARRDARDRGGLAGPRAVPVGS